MSPTALVTGGIRCIGQAIALDLVDSVNDVAGAARTLMITKGMSTFVTSLSGAVVAWLVIFQKPQKFSDRTLTQSHWHSRRTSMQTGARRFNCWLVVSYVFAVRTLGKVNMKSPATSEPPATSKNGTVYSPAS